MSDFSLEQVLDKIREASKNESEKGHKFEKLMLKFFQNDPTYRSRV